MTSRILAMNDDQAILELYQTVLEEEGYAVSLTLVEIESAKEVEQFHPDLIILDLKMGRHNAGLLLLQQLKMYRPTKDIPIIVCTAAMHEMQEQEATFQQRGIPLVYKPFDLDEFLKIVRKMVPPHSHDVRRSNPSPSSHEYKPMRIFSFPLKALQAFEEDHRGQKAS